VNVNDHNEVPEHVVDEADRLGFAVDTGIPMRRNDGPGRSVHYYDEHAADELGLLPGYLSDHEKRKAIAIVDDLEAAGLTDRRRALMMVASAVRCPERLRDYLAQLVPPPRIDEPDRCECGRQLDENGEHDGGYGAFCGDAYRYDETATQPATEVYVFTQEEQRRRYEAARAVLERQKVKRDLELYGTAFLVDGRRVDPTTVEVRSADDTRGEDDCARFQCRGCGSRSHDRRSELDEPLELAETGGRVKSPGTFGSTPSPGKRAKTRKCPGFFARRFKRSDGGQ
jgi:hypothetical protein